VNARESIESLWDRATPVAPLLDAYRAEVLCEATEKIRNSKKLRDLTDDHMSDVNAAADLIDPEVAK
jgi:hypothetical protein